MTILVWRQHSAEIQLKTLPPIGVRMPRRHVLKFSAVGLIMHLL